MVAVMRRLGFVDSAAQLLGLHAQRFRDCLMGAPRFQMRTLERLRARLCELGAYEVAGVSVPVFSVAAASVDSSVAG